MLPEMRGNLLRRMRIDEWLSLSSKWTDPHGRSFHRSGEHEHRSVGVCVPVQSPSNANEATVVARLILDPRAEGNADPHRRSHQLELELHGNVSEPLELIELQTYDRASLLENDIL